MERVCHMWRVKWVFLSQLSIEHCHGWARYSAKMVYSLYKRQRILYYFYKGCRAPTIAKQLRDENITASRQGIHKFLRKYIETRSIERRPGSGRPSKATREVKKLVEDKMREDDEMTAYQLHRLLQSQGYKLSIQTILCCRKSLGWTFRGSAYCQLIRQENKRRRLEWVRQHLNDSFDDVLWTDDCSVQMESHRWFCCRKRGEAPKNKPRYNVHDIE